MPLHVCIQPAYATLTSPWCRLGTCEYSQEYSQSKKSHLVSAVRAGALWPQLPQHRGKVGLPTIQSKECFGGGIFGLLGGLGGFRFQEALGWVYGVPLGVVKGSSGST
jgi:hypothetical protein